LLRFSKMFRS